MNGIKETKEAEFKSEVLDADGPVLVDFYAPWCGPCKALGPALESIARAYEGRLKIVKLDVDEAPQVAADNRIQGVPTLMFFQNGEAVDTLVGLPSANVLRAKLDTYAAESRKVTSCSCCCA